MAYVDWRLRGPELATCNCDWGCPCQFNSRPSNGHCQAAVAMRIDEGHFGDVRLDGLKWVGLFAWPAAIHEGHGTCRPVVDARADEAQRGALLAILSGQESVPGATYFNVFASTLETVLEPLFRDIEFEIDIDARTGRFVVAGLVEAEAEPIRNPVTGDEHRARIVLPHGFEYGEAEFASSRATASGPPAFAWPKGHAHLTMIHIGTEGVVR